MQITVKKEEENVRIDNFLKERTDLSRNYISSLIEEGFLSVNGVVLYKASYKVKENDLIFFEEKEPEILDVEAKDIPIDVIYEDNDILIVNKEQGMVVHPAAGHIDDTLVNAIMYRCKDNLSTINGVMRPGIVHRIDKDTSGLIVICKNDEAHKNIALQFEEHSHIRKYRAVVKGVLEKDEGTIIKNIVRDKRDRKKMAVTDNVNEGRYAETEYKVIKRYNNYTYVELNLKTGRTHQIRVHMKSINHPILGDEVYGKKDRNFQELKGQTLHANFMSFRHPRTKEVVSFEAPLPIYFENIIKKIEDNNL